MAPVSVRLWQEFKLVSLKMIVSSMLHYQSRRIKHSTLTNASSRISDADDADVESGCCKHSQTALATSGSGHSRKATAAVGTPPENSLGRDLYVPGELTQRPLTFLTRTTLVVSSANLGCEQLAQELIQRYPELRSEAARDVLPAPGEERDSAGDSSSRIGFSASPLTSPFQSKTATIGIRSKHPSKQQRRLDHRGRIFLLYLNKETWLGEQGSELAAQVSAAKEAGIKIVLAHENDPQLGGCDFSHFFSTVSSHPKPPTARPTV